MTSAEPTHTTESAKPRIRVEEILLLVLLFLSVGGVAITDLSRMVDLRYWLAVVTLFAGTGLYLGWAKARSRGMPMGAILTRQALHWLVLVLGMYVVSQLQTTGRLNNEAAGLVALLVLAVITLLAGVHFDWLFVVLGTLLTLMVIFVALLEQYLWVLLILGAVVGGLVLLWFRRQRTAT